MPQIELMMMDLPHTLYLKTGKDKKKKHSQEDYDKAAEINRKLAEKSRLRRQKQMEQVTVEDVFDGALEPEEN